MIFIKKSLICVILTGMILLSACSGREMYFENDAAAPATVQDSRTASPAPLETVPFSVPDPQNEKRLPETRIEHSYGVSKDGIPHENSIDAQNFFESKGYNAICCDLKSTRKVLYLTFDCGWENGCTAGVLDTLKEKNVPAAFFCTLDHIRSSPELIRRMIGEGHIVGNHSANHPDFSRLSREEMAKEILECDNCLRTEFGYTSPFFRFPEGAYNESALDLIGTMGYTCVFWSSAYVDWDTDNQHGADFAFETVTARFHPGSIILLHSVSSDNEAALGDIIDCAREQGYEFHPLTDFGKM